MKCAEDADYRFTEVSVDDELAGMEQAVEAIEAHLAIGQGIDGDRASLMPRGAPQNVGWRWADQRRLEGRVGRRGKVVDGPKLPVDQILWRGQRHTEIFPRAQREQLRAQPLRRRLTERASFDNR